MIKQNKPISIFAIIVCAVLSIFFSVLDVKAKTSSNELDNYKLAAEYSNNARGLSILVIKKGKVVFEEYHNGHSANTPHRLASGTKSFSGVILAAAIQDGLVESFDEKVSKTITEWKNDEKKSKITLRQILSLTSGVDAGRIGRPPVYSEAINYPVKFDAGTAFQYGPAPFQMFGEVMKRKLASKNETVLDYLKRRILNPIGLEIGDWKMQEGQPNLPSGASLTTREWAKFGQLLLNEGKWKGKRIVKKNLLKELTKGSDANPNYGITFWLNRSFNTQANVYDNNPRQRRDTRHRQTLRQILNRRSETYRVSQNGFGKNLPNDIFVAAGAGKQRLYVIPSKKMVIVRQGRASRFRDRDFLNRLLFGKK